MEEPTGDYVSVFFSLSELIVNSIFSFSSSLEKVLRQIRRSIVSFLWDFQRMYSMLHSYKTKFHSHQRSSAVYLHTTGNYGGFLGGLDGHGHLLYSVFKSSINEELMKSGKFITDTRTHFFHSSSDKWVYQSNGWGNRVWLMWVFQVLHTALIVLFCLVRCIER